MLRGLKTTALLVVTIQFVVVGCGPYDVAKRTELPEDASQVLKEVGERFVASQRQYPTDACPDNAPSTLDDCIQRNEAELSRITMINCPQDPVVRKRVQAEPLNPLTSDIKTLNVRAPPFVAVHGGGSLTATIDSFCDWSVEHVHDGTGLPDQSDPRRYVSRQVVATVRFQAKADDYGLEISGIKGKIPITGTIEAGDAVDLGTFLYKKCRYTPDNHPCDERLDTPIQPSLQ